MTTQMRAASLGLALLALATNGRATAWIAMFLLLSCELRGVGTVATLRQNAGDVSGLAVPVLGLGATAAVLWSTYAPFETKLASAAQTTTTTIS